MDLDEVEVDKNTKKNQVQIQLSWPNKLAWSIRNLFMDKKRTFLAGPTLKHVLIFWTWIAPHVKAHAYVILTTFQEQMTECKMANHSLGAKAISIPFLQSYLNYMYDLVRSIVKIVQIAGSFSTIVVMMDSKL